MKFNNIPEVKLGIVAVSRDCFPIALSTSPPGGGGSGLRGGGCTTAPSPWKMKQTP